MNTAFDQLKARREYSASTSRALVVLEQDRQTPELPAPAKGRRLSSVSAAVLSGAALFICCVFSPLRSGSLDTVTFTGGETPTSYAAQSRDDMFRAFRDSYLRHEQALAKTDVPVAPPPVTWSKSDLIRLAGEIAAEEGVNQDLFDAVIRAESNYEIHAVSSKGAMSLAQLMPATAAELGLAPADYFDPEKNLRGGARYLRGLLDEFKDPGMALAAYNAGASRVRGRTPSHWPAETRDYVSKILRRSGASSEIVRGDKAATFHVASLTGSIASMAQPGPGSLDISVEGSSAASADEVPTISPAAQNNSAAGDVTLETAAKAFLAKSPEIAVDAGVTGRSAPSLKAEYLRLVKGADK